MIGVVGRRDECLRWLEGQDGWDGRRYLPRINGVRVVMGNSVRVFVGRALTRVVAVEGADHTVLTEARLWAAKSAAIPPEVE